MSGDGPRATARRDRAKDLPQLVELLGVLFTEEAEFQPDAEKQKRALEAILADPIGRQALRARDEGKRVVAMASLLYTISTAEGGKAALFEDLVVHPDERKRGIGEALLKHVVDAGARRRRAAHHAAHRHAERARAGDVPPRRLRRLADEADAPEDQERAGSVGSPTEADAAADQAPLGRSAKILPSVARNGTTSAPSSTPCALSSPRAAAAGCSAAPRRRDGARCGS